MIKKIPFKEDGIIEVATNDQRYTKQYLNIWNGEYAMDWKKKISRYWKRRKLKKLSLM